MSLPLVAYHDRKCTYGYMVLCDKCLPDAPRHVAKDSPLSCPPNGGTTQQCEMCKRQGVLFTASAKLAHLQRKIVELKIELHRDHGIPPEVIDRLIG